MNEQEVRAWLECDMEYAGAGGLSGLCSYCDGKGVIDYHGVDVRECPTCGGTGYDPSVE